MSSPKPSNWDDYYKAMPKPSNLDKFYPAPTKPLAEVKPYCYIDELGKQAGKAIGLVGFIWLLVWLGAKLS